MTEPISIQLKDPSHMEILNRYKREAPEIFARLPLPKKLAEDLGVPYDENPVHLNTYLKKFMVAQAQPIHEAEERVACEIKSDVKSLLDVCNAITDSREIPQDPPAPKSASQDTR